MSVYTGQTNVCACAGCNNEMAFRLLSLYQTIEMHSKRVTSLLSMVAYTVRTINQKRLLLSTLLIIITPLCFSGIALIILI